MKPLGSVAAVVSAIREDAAAEVEVIERDAAEQVARLGGGAPAGDAARHTAAVAAARERAHTSVSQEDWEDTRVSIAEREAWIGRVVERGRERLTDRVPADQRRATLARLAREGLARLPSGPIEIEMSEADAAVLDAGWRDALAGPSGADSIRVVVGQLDGGCIIRSADGRAVFDNSFAARWERLQSQWRSLLFECHERATAGIATEGPAS